MRGPPFPHKGGASASGVATGSKVKFDAHVTRVSLVRAGAECVTRTVISLSVRPIPT